MSLIGIFTSWLSSPPGGPGLMVIDGTSMANGRSRRFSPRDLLTLLDKLARLSEQEGISVIALFEGDPLRKVGDGEDHKGVTVYYADDEASLQARLLQEARKRHAIVITSNPELETLVHKRGLRTLRASTLYRMMESSQGEASDNGPRRSGGRPPADSARRPRRRSRREREPKENKSNNEPASDVKQDAVDPVRELIDLVE